MSLTSRRGRWPKQAPRVYIAVDPGVTTGIAIWNRNSPDEVQLHEVGPKATMQIIKPWTPAKAAHIFTERFDIGNETVRVNPPVDSLYLNGWMMLEATPLRYTEIGRGDAKGFTDNKRLRHYGWWQVGSKDHCRDAARVLAYAMAHFDEPWLLDKMESYLEGLT